MPLRPFGWNVNIPTYLLTEEIHDEDTDFRMPPRDDELALTSRGTTTGATSTAGFSVTETSTTGYETSRSPDSSRGATRYT